MVRYEIRVRGTVPDDEAERLGLVVVRRAAETVLSGSVVDQAQLRGLIERVFGLGLELVEVRRDTAPEADARDPAP